MKDKHSPIKGRKYKKISIHIPLEKAKEFFIYWDYFKELTAEDERIVLPEYETEHKRYNSKRKASAAVREFVKKYVEKNKHKLKNETISESPPVSENE